MPEIIALFLKNTALGRWISSAGLKTLLWLVFIVVVGLSAWFVYHHIDTLNQQIKTQAAQLVATDTELGQKQQQLVDLTQANTELNAQLKTAQATMSNNDVAIAALQTVQVANQKKHDVQVTNLHSYVKTVEDNTTFTDSQKSQLIAASYLETLWTGHCSLDASNPTCARFATTPSGEVNPDVANPPATPSTTPVPPADAPPTSTPVPSDAPASSPPSHAALEPVMEQLV